MKKFLVFYLFVFIVSYAVSMPPVTAAQDGTSQHLPAGKILEFSLSRLKESMRKTMQKNERFAFENEELRRGILDLQRTRDALAARKAGLSGEPLPAVLRPRPARFAETVDIDKRGQKTQELAAILGQEIGRLQERIRVLEEAPDEKGFEAERRMLSGKKEESRRSLSRAEKKFKSLKKKNTALLRTIEALRKKQDALKRKIRALEGGD